MARTNKYTSINFNHVLEKNTCSSSNAGNPTKQPLSSFSSITSPNSHLHAARTHGRMLVLTKPTPKPISITPPLSPSPSASSPHTQQPQAQTPVLTRSEPDSDQISLRPLGRTGTSSETFSPVLGQERDKEVVSVVVLSPKPDKFIPPHLRPGFTGRKERPGPEGFRARESGQKHFGSLGRYGEDGRPKSGGNERTRRGGESDPGLVSRPSSSGNRPSSSGSWYGSCLI